MRRAKLAARRKRLPRLTIVQRQDRRRYKRKFGPSGVRRKERRAHLQLAADDAQPATPELATDAQPVIGDAQPVEQE